MGAEVWTPAPGKPVRYWLSFHLLLGCVDMKYRFAAASAEELIVFGASRPGYRKEQVDDWLAFMQGQGIQRICCLLTEARLMRYGGLLSHYQQIFGADRVCWAPIEDFQLADCDALVGIILPFLAAANRAEEKVVVHCSGGIGRTGQALAAWLVAERGLSNQAAIATVRASGRNPCEAASAAPLRGQTPQQVVAQSHQLLDDCRRAHQAD